MVNLDQLEALDMQLWLRSGVAASLYCLCNESSITRRTRAALKIFGLTLNKDIEFQLIGNVELINSQREVHQKARFNGYRPLRLEATHYIKQYLSKPPVQGWHLGSCDHRGCEVLLSLLSERIIDAYVTSDLEDLPTNPEFTVIPLWAWPGELVVHPFHPLAKSRNISRGDLDRFPSLIIPENLYPKLSQLIYFNGFGNNRILPRYDIGSWEEITDDALTISYGSCLSIAVNSNLARLNWQHDITGGEALVLMSDCLEQQAIALLLDDLKRRVMRLQSLFPQLKVQL